MMDLSTKKFIEGATSAITSEVFDNYKGDNITLQASGTATSFSAKLQGKADINADWVDVALINLKDLTVSSAISTTDIYQGSLTGVTQIRISLNAISGGPLTIFGRVTN